MKICIHPAFERMRSFVEALPHRFETGQSETLHEARNTVRAFAVGEERVVVKRFQRPNLFRAVVYTYFRKSKARRAYEHALRLRSMGIDSPAPVAWSEYYRHGLLRDSYLVTLRSDYAPLSQTTPQFPAPETRPVLDAFAGFVIRLHAAGVVHEDFNHGNILWQYDTATGEYRFQLIDINRMRFHARPLEPRRCMVNLRRLSCPALAFLYILDRYAEQRDWNIDDTLLRGTFFRLAFLHRRKLRKRFRRRRQAIRGKKRA